jgi:hypothetical protein
MEGKAGTSYMPDTAYLLSSMIRIYAPGSSAPRVLRFMGSTSFSSDLTAKYLLVPVRNRKRLVGSLPITQGADATLTPDVHELQYCEVVSTMIPIK